MILVIVGLSIMIDCLEAIDMKRLRIVIAVGLIVIAVTVVLLVAHKVNTDDTNPVVDEYQQYIEQGTYEEKEHFGEPIEYQKDKEREELIKEILEGVTQ